MKAKPDKEIREQLKKDAIKDADARKRANKHTTDKMLIQHHLVSFSTNDDLFELLEAVKLGIGILESEGFPLKELSTYKLKEWISQTKNSKK